MSQKQIYPGPPSLPLPPLATCRCAPQVFSTQRGADAILGSFPTAYSQTPPALSQIPLSLLETQNTQKATFSWAAAVAWEPWVRSVFSSLSSRQEFLVSWARECREGNSFRARNFSAPIQRLETKPGIWGPFWILVCP